MLRKDLGVKALQELKAQLETSVGGTILGGWGGGGEALSPSGAVPESGLPQWMAKPLLGSPVVCNAWLV